MSWKDYFYFTKTERNGIMVLVILIIIIILLPFFHPLIFPAKVYDFSEFDSKVDRFEQMLAEYREARIAIEIDGSVHDTNEQKEYDIQRSNALELAGIHVIRFKNNLVKENLDEVLNQIYSDLISRYPPTP